MKKAGDLLSSFFDERTLATASGYSELFSAWRMLVGERIAAHSRIVELEHEMLIVEADHPGWIQVLQIKQADILSNARKRFPELSIHGISLKLAKSGSFPEVNLNVDIKSPTGDENIIEESISEKNNNLETNSVFDRIDDESFKETLKRLEKGIQERSGKNKGR